MINEVYRQAYVDVLYEKSKQVLCPHCASILEDAALDRYKTLMAQRRKEIAGLQAKAQKEREAEARRKELEKQNKNNNSKKGARYE